MNYFRHFQEVFLLPSLELPVLQIPTPRPPERAQGVGLAEGGAPQGLLQHPQSGHSHPCGFLHEPEAPAAVHQEDAQEQRGRGGLRH